MFYGKWLLEGIWCALEFDLGMRWDIESHFLDRTLLSRISCLVFPVLRRMLS